VSLRYERRITRAMLKAEPQTLWVFGDNLQRRGLGGQAREMRGEPNAIGIPTKRAPGMGDGDFMRDEDFDTFRNEAAGSLSVLRLHLEAGGSVVWPADGIGTGLARLPDRAPKVWAALERARIRLEAVAASGMSARSVKTRSG